MGRLNLIFAGLSLLFFMVGQFFPLDRRVVWNLILAICCIPDIALSIWLHRQVSSRRLQEIQLSVLILSIFFRVTLLTFFLLRLFGEPLPTFGETPPLFSLEGLVSFAKTMCSLAIALYIVHWLYTRILTNNYAPYKYANADIPRRFTIYERIDDSTFKLYATLGRIFSLSSIFNSKLVGWLPAYPVKWNFRVIFHERDGRYQLFGAAPQMPPPLPVITVLYDKHDLHLADFLTENLDKGYIVQTQVLPTTGNIEYDTWRTCIPIITPYSVQAANIFCKNYPQVRCIPFLMQKVEMPLPEPLKQIQYVDAHRDYQAALLPVRELLNGRASNIVTGEVENRSKFYLPPSALVLFFPSILVLFASTLLFTLTSLMITVGHEMGSTITVEDPVALFIGLVIILIFINILPILVIINGMQRKYSLSTIAIVNLVMTLPLIPVLLAGFTTPEAICGLPVVGSLIFIPPVLSALLAWTDIDLSRLFGNAPASPKVWAPNKGLSWGILSYMVLLIIVAILLALVSES